MEITDRTITLSGSILFDNLRAHICPQCGSIYYFYDDNRLVFATTHRNTVHIDDEYYFTPECPTCQAEYAHMVKAVELMKRSGE